MHINIWNMYPVLQSSGGGGGGGGGVTNISRALQDIISKYVHCTNRTSYMI